MTTFNSEDFELAAKAAGIEVIRSRLDDPMNRDMLIKKSPRNPDQVAGPWNPRDDDGDSQRLAVALGLNVDVHRLFPFCGWQRPWVEVRGYESRRVLATAVADDHGPSLEAAAREAIFLAAIAIGRAMP